MASYAFQGVRYRTTDGGPAHIEVYGEAASQTFKAGDLVTLSSGLVAEAAAEGADVGAGTILGMALSPATGVTGSRVEVAVAGERTLFSLPVYHATPASAITATASIGAATMDITRQTVGGVSSFAVDINDTSNANASLVNIDANYPVGEQYGRYWVRIPAAKRTLA